MQVVNRQDCRQEILDELAHDVQTIAFSLNTLSDLLGTKADNTVDNPLTDILHGTANLIRLCEESLDDLTAALRRLANQEGGAR